MTNKQKILRASEIKQILNPGGGLPDPIFGKQPPEKLALITELEALEWAIAAAESMEEAREINQ